MSPQICQTLQREGIETYYKLVWWNSSFFPFLALVRRLKAVSLSCSKQPSPALLIKLSDAHQTFPPQHLLQRRNLNSGDPQLPASGETCLLRSCISSKIFAHLVPYFIIHVHNVTYLPQIF